MGRSRTRESAEATVELHAAQPPRGSGSRHSRAATAPDEDRQRRAAGQKPGGGRSVGKKPRASSDRGRGPGVPLPPRERKGMRPLPI
eukprot:scaffold96921_cov39-Phaeocystis_antarctica.AAC.1